MWKPIRTPTDQETQYFLLFSETTKFYEIFVTDYLNVWSTLFSKKAFVAQLKKSNVGLELPAESAYVQKGVHLLSNIGNLNKFSIEKKENDKSLFISLSISFGFPFYLECTLSKGAEELFFQKVTRPLLKTVCDLRESQSELRTELIKKDCEIEEYKCEGGKIALRHLKTTAYNDAEHRRKHPVYEENFGSSTALLEEAVQILDKSLQKQKPNAIENLDPAIHPSIKTEQPILDASHEPGSVLMTGTPVIKTEPDITVTTESIPSVKVEPKTEESSVNYKQEIKREQARAHIPRKRSKFNF